MLWILLRLLYSKSSDFAVEVHYSGDRRLKRNSQGCYSEISMTRVKFLIEGVRSLCSENSFTEGFLAIGLFDYYYYFFMF